MADTASYAGAMKTHYPDTSGYTAKEKGNRRPGSLRGGMPLGVHRSAAQKRLGKKFSRKQGVGSHDEKPGPKAIRNIRPI